MKFIKIWKPLKNLNEVFKPQQNKVLKVFSKNGNASKKEETPQQNKV